MFNQAFWISLRILIFRAGPQDFPFDTGKTLSRACLALAVVAYGLFWMVVTPPLAALAIALVTVAAMALVTRAALRLRKLPERFQQTFNTLLAINALLTLAMIPAFARLAPPLIELFQSLQQHPELADQPEKWPQLSGGASAVLNVLGFWQLAVTARVFAQASNGNVFSGVLLALLAMLAISLLLLFVSPLIGLLLI